MYFSKLYTQPFILAQMKENIKAPRHWPLCGEFTGGRWIPRTNGQLREKCFHLMTSSCAICAECASSYQLYIGLWRVFTIMGSAINDWINKFVFFTLVFKKIRKRKYEFFSEMTIDKYIHSRNVYFRMDIISIMNIVCGSIYLEMLPSKGGLP